MQVEISEFSDQIKYINIKCITKYHLVIILILFSFCFIIYKAILHSHLLFKPITIFIFKIFVCTLVLIIIPEKESRFIFSLLIFEFKIVSLFYGSIFIIIQMIFKRFLFIFEIDIDQDNELFLS